MKQYHVYVLASHSENPALYIGVTSELAHRIWQHKNKVVAGFTGDYNCDKLVYFEEAISVDDAIKREKQLKNWHRQWKLNLITASNPNLADLSLGWNH